MATFESMKSNFITSALLAIVFFGFAQVCYGQGYQIKQISKMFFENETTVAVSPDHKQVVVASNVAAYFRSSDSGHSWKPAQLSSSLGVWGDPVLLYTQNGALLYAHLAKNPRKKGYNALDRMVVQRSTNHGQTWNDGVGVGFNGAKMQDKEWLHQDISASSPYKGRIYISWTEFDRYGSKKKKHKSRIRLAYSDDDGLSFSAAQTVGKQEGNCLDDDDTPEGATVATDANGKVYVVWAAFGKIWMSTSPNGGETFGDEIAIADQPGGWSIEVPNIFRSNGLPFVTAIQNQLFVTYTKAIEGQNTKIMLLTSLDKGTSWSEEELPILADTLGLSFEGHRFFPCIRAHSNGQQIGLLAYEQNLTHDSLRVFLYTKAINEHKWNAAFISPAFSSPGKELFFGDYIHLAPYKQGFFVVWTAHKKGFLHVWGAFPE